MFNTCPKGILQKGRVMDISNRSMFCWLFGLGLCESVKPELWNSAVGCFWNNSLVQVFQVKYGLCHRLQCIIYHNLRWAIAGHICTEENSEYQLCTVNKLHQHYALQQHIMSAQIGDMLIVSLMYTMAISWGTFCPASACTWLQYANQWPWHLAVQV